MLIPLGDDNTGRRSRPVITPLLIVLNALVFLYQLSLGPRQERFLMAWAVTPYEITHAEDLVGRVQLTPAAIPGPTDIGAPPEDNSPVIEHADNPLLAGPLIGLTILSAMFMHGGWLHILGNMLFLWIFGDNVEDEMGRGRFLGFYLLVGLLGTVAHIVSGPNSLLPSLGASGAISGVMAAYLVLHPKRKIRIFFIYRTFRVSAAVFVGGWALLQLINGLGALAPTAETGGVAYMAHLGGFAAGLVLVWIFRLKRPPIGRESYA